MRLAPAHEQEIQRGFAQPLSEREAISSYSDLIKAAKGKPYTGKGKRKGTSGHYTYTYGLDPQGKAEIQIEPVARLAGQTRSEHLAHVLAGRSGKESKYTQAQDAMREIFDAAHGVAKAEIESVKAWMPEDLFEAFGLHLALGKNADWYKARSDQDDTWPTAGGRSDRPVPTRWSAERLNIADVWRDDPERALRELHPDDREKLEQVFDRVWEYRATTPRQDLSVEMAFGDEAHAREARRGDVLAQPDLFVGDVIAASAPVYYASGSNSPAQIKGLARIGAAEIGVAAPHVGKAAEEELKRLAGQTNPRTGSLVKVFVDSGAFTEVDFPRGVPTVVKPITPAEWDKRLGLYERLSGALGNQLAVVAPDKVGFQIDTLNRMTHYAPRVQSILDKGTEVLIPLQGGRMKIADFEARARAALGDHPGLIPALPMKKGATTLQQIAAYVTAIKPDRIHLLGMGEKNKRAIQVEKLIRRLSPMTVVSMDSSLIRANVGRGERQKKKKKEAAPQQPLLLSISSYSDLVKAAKAAKPYTGKGERKGTPGDYTYEYGKTKSPPRQLALPLDAPRSPSEFRVGDVYSWQGDEYKIEYVNIPGDQIGVSSEAFGPTVKVDGSWKKTIEYVSGKKFRQDLEAEQQRLDQIQATVDHYDHDWELDLGLVYAHVEVGSVGAPDLFLPAVSGESVQRRANRQPRGGDVFVTIRLTPKSGGAGTTETFQARDLWKLEHAMGQGAGFHPDGPGRAETWPTAPEAQVSGSGLQREVTRLRRARVAEKRLQTLTLNHPSTAALAPDYDPSVYDDDDYEGPDDGGRVPMIAWGLLTEAQRQILTSIELFTNHNVDTVRAPYLFDPKKVVGSSGNPGSGKKVSSAVVTGQLADGDSVPITRQTYERANEIMKALAAAPYDAGAPETIYRGMGLSGPAVNALKEGAVFDGGDIASWSGKRRTAKEFADDVPGLGVLFVLKDPKRGTYVDGLSRFQLEDEVVSSGKMRIVRRSEAPISGMTVVEVEHI